MTELPPIRSSRNCRGRTTRLADFLIMMYYDAADAAAAADADADAASTASISRLQLCSMNYGFLRRRFLVDLVVALVCSFCFLSVFVFCLL